jgi:hypothetical protein
MRVSVCDVARLCMLLARFCIQLFQQERTTGPVQVPERPLLAYLEKEDQEKMRNTGPHTQLHRAIHLEEGASMKIAKKTLAYVACWLLSLWPLPCWLDWLEPVYF